MAKLRRVSGNEMLRFLAREGFAIVRVRGSHHFCTRGAIDTVVHEQRPLRPALRCASPTSRADAV